MSVPYYILLILYLVGVGVFLMWMFFNLYHLIKFGLFDFTGKLNGTIFILFSIAVIVVTFILLSGTPWLDTFELFSLPSGILEGTKINSGGFEL